MCGRYALYQTEGLWERYGLAPGPKFVAQDNYNVSPRQRLPVVYRPSEKPLVELMRWGFIPAWSKDATKGLQPINTKSETVFDSPMWRASIAHKRCLVPARGFYEWKTVADTKLPYYIRPKRHELFSFAGIYSEWKDAEGLPLYSFSIMTTRPSKEMRPIHDRMPVILRPDQEAAWLDPTIDEPESLAGLLLPYEDGGLDIHRVGMAVNSPSQNGRQLIVETHD